MAKKSMIAREVKRRKLNEQHHAVRESLRQRVVDESLSYDERWQAMLDLQKLPRDSARTRQRNRCALLAAREGTFGALALRETRFERSSCVGKPRASSRRAGNPDLKI